MKVDCRLYQMSIEKFRTQYLPLIRRIVEAERLDVNVPQCGYPGIEASPQMGQLLNSIRSGKTSAPREFMDYIFAKGFDLNRADAEHERPSVSEM